MPYSRRSRQSLLLVNQHYYPDVASTGQHLTDLAEFLAREGYDVEVLCGRGRYLSGQLAVPDHEVRQGVGIRRLRTTSFGRGTHVGRLVDYASFYVQVLFALLFGRRCDGVIFLTTPPLLGVLGAIARVLRGQRYAIWSMDLHPDAEIASGMLAPRGVVARVLSWLNAIGYRRADTVVDLGPFMKRRVLEMGVPPERTRTVHVWSSGDEIAPTAVAENPLVEELGLRSKFVVMYSGNAGVVHDFAAILEAMRRLKDDPDVFFLFVGDGPRRAEIERFALQHRITNFQYRGYFPREQLRWSLSLARVHLISLRAPFVGISVPGKLYGIMAAARPALFVGPRHCESAQTILATGCGAVIDPEGQDAAEHIIRVLRQWRADPHAAAELGRRGRAAFLEQFDKAPNCDAWARLLRDVWVPVNARAEDEVVLPAPLPSVYGD